MSDQLPPELRERIRAYVEDVAPAGQADELEGLILEQLERRQTRQPAQVMAIAHETVSSRIRITPDAAAAALVDHGGLSQVVAAHIVGLPVHALLDAGNEEPEAEEPDAEEPAVEEPADEPADEDPIVDGWNDFWAPPTTDADDGAGEPGSAEDDVGEAAPPETAPETAPETVRVRVDDGDTSAPVAPRPSGTFETWTGGASRQGRTGRGGLVAAAVVVGVVLLAIIGIASLGGGDGDPVAVGDPTEPVANTTSPAADAGTDTDTDTDSDTDTETEDTPANAGGVTVADGQVTADGGGAVQAGSSAQLSMTVSGTDDQAATLQWELRRDGDEVFAPAPLVVPADGDVRLTIPPALLADAGAYLVRVSRDGAVLFEQEFEVSG